MKLSRIVTGCLSVALLAFMVSDTLAQDGQRRGDRGDRGGRPGGGFQRGGGPGGGGPGGGRPGGGDPTFQVLRTEEVQTELQISPDQKEALTKLAEQGRPERPNVDFRSMSEEERRAFFEKMQKEQAERTAKMKEQLEEVLLPEQIERLEQIVLQVRGVQALGDEKVADELKMTEEQKKKLDEVREGLREKMGAKMQEMQEIFRSGDRDAIREEMGKVRVEIEGEVLAVLSDDQQKQFEEMKGEKFEMPEGFGRGGFTGRGGPGGGRGGFGGGPGGRRPGGGDGGGRPQRPETEE